LNTGNKFSLVSAGGGHNCGITTNGDTYCWGDNYFGDLGGLGTLPNYVNSPVYVYYVRTDKNQQPRFVTVSAGYNGNCGLVAIGDAYCWGAIPGQNRGMPVEGGFHFSVLDAGDRHACGIDSSGAPYCWGENTHGELGNGSDTPTPSYLSPPVTSVPGAVVGGLTYTTIDVGDPFTCGLTINGIVYCWGANGSGQLGNGSTTHSDVPVKVLGQM
jgi:alpha-tubulin suppressor-like RCC1 family protein